VLDRNVNAKVGVDLAPAISDHCAADWAFKTTDLRADRIAEDIVAVP
jgi:hypothetical protein